MRSRQPVPVDPVSVHPPFRLLVRVHAGDVRRLARGHGVPESADEDVAQAVFFLLWRALQRGQVIAALPSWLRTVTWRVASRYHTAERRAHAAGSPSEGGPPASTVREVLTFELGGTCEAEPRRARRVTARESNTERGRAMATSRGRARAAVLFSSIVLLLLSLRRAAAEPAADGAALARALSEGAAASARGDHAACVAAFTRALRLSADPLTAGKLGLCEEALGHHVAAFDHLRLAMESEPGPAAGGGKGPWERFANALERLRRRVVRVLVVVSPSDAEVWIDGAPFGAGWSGRYVTLAPGEHTWTARREGHEDATFSHAPRGGDVPDVRLTLPPRPKAALDPPCDRACRAEIQADADRRARATLEESVRRRVRWEVEELYRRRMDPGVAFFAGGLLAAGLTPDVAPGFVVGGELSWGAFSSPAFTAGLEVQTLLPTVVYRYPGGAYADITQITAALVPCLRFKWISGCGFADVGMVIGGGLGQSYPAGNVLATVGLGPRLGFQIPFADRFMIRAFAELRFSPITDTGFADIEAPANSWINPPVSGLFGLTFSIGSPVRE